MNLGGIQKTSLIDYPNKISAIIFTQGCNFRCGYCHNPELIKTDGSSIEESSVLDFLKTRIKKLDGVVITGGEPTLQNDLPDFIKKIKDIGFPIKLDTNGTNPEMIEYLVKNNLIDYIAMDIKGPFNKYENIVQSKTNISDIKKSIETIINSQVEYEFRTTVVKSQLSTTDFIEIGKMIKSAEKYYLQEFVPSKTLDNRFLNERTHSKEEFDNIIKILNSYISEVYLR